MNTNTPADYWDQKTLCALRWIVMLNAMPMLSLEVAVKLLVQIKAESAKPSEVSGSR